jgi:hypothetical protein
MPSCSSGPPVPSPTAAGLDRLPPTALHRQRSRPSVSPSAETPVMRRSASASATALRGSPAAVPAGDSTFGETDPVAFSTSSCGTRCAVGRSFPVQRGPPHWAVCEATWHSPLAPGLRASPGAPECTSATTSGFAGNREAHGSSPRCTASVIARQPRCSVGSFASSARSSRFPIPNPSRAGPFPRLILDRDPG